MRVVVTGGSGFIGSALAARLVDDGHDVVNVDLRPPPAPAGDWLEADLRHPDTIAGAVTPGVEAVVHLAASTSVLRSVEDPAGVHDNNVTVTARLLEACRTAGVSRFVLASTNAVVGGGLGDGPGDIDENSPLLPLTPYGATKAAAEMLVSGYRAAYGIDATSLRLTNVYGPGIEVKDGLVARLMKAARSGDAVPVYGDGRQVRDYVFLGDVVAAMAAGVTGRLPARVVIGAGRSVDVWTMHRLVCAAAGADIRLDQVEAKAGEMRRVEVSTAGLTAAGLGQPTGLEEGLAVTWSDFFSHG